MASKRETLIASAEKNLQKGKVEPALKDYLKVLEETPNDINVLNKVGDLFVRLNRNEESLTYFNKIAEHYAKDGFFLKSIAIYKKINKLDPARLDVYERLAELYAKQGLGMEAKSQYQVLADYYLKQDSLSGAIGIYHKMVQGDPGNLQLHVKLADLLTQAKRIGEAIKEYAVVAGMLRERGASSEAAQVYEKALRIAPDNIEILRVFVPLQLEAGNVDGARGALKRALETTPRSVPLFLLAAETALTANDMAEARSYASKAQAVEPDNEEVLALVVKVQLKGRRPDLAFAAAAPLADHAVRKGEPRKALALLTPIAKAAPDNEDLLRKIVDVASASGDETSTVPYRSALAEIWRKQGRIVEAAEALQKCALLVPGNAEFRARFAQLEPLLPKPAAPEAPAPPAADFSIPGVPVRAVSPVAPESAPPAPPAGDEFEFELADEELVEVPPEPAAPAPAPAQPAAFTEPTLPGAAPWGQAGAPAPVWDPYREPAESAAEALARFQSGDIRGVPPRSAPLSSSFGEAIEEAEEAPQFSIAIPPVAAAAVRRVEPTPIEEIEASAAIDEPTPLPVPRHEALPAAPPPAPARPAVDDAAADEALVEAEIYRKYGLPDKALELLRPLAPRFPDHVRLREKLFELLLEKGLRGEAKAEAEALTAIYRTQGKTERIKGLYSLLGESAPEEEPPPSLFAPEAPSIEEAPEVGIVEAVEVVEEEPVEPELAGAEAAPSFPAPQAAPIPAPVAAPVPLAEPEPPVEIAPPAIPPAPPPETLPAAHQAADAEPPTEPLPPLPPAPAPPPSPAPRTTVKLSVDEILGGPKKKGAEPKKPSASDLTLAAVEALRPSAPAPAAKPRPVRPEDILLPVPSPRPARARPPATPSKPIELPPELAMVEEAHRHVPAHRPVPPPVPEAAPPPSPPAPSDELSLDAFAVDVVARQGREEAPPPAPAAVPEPEPSPAPVEAPPVPPAPPVPTPEELSEVDFCLDQGMVVDAAERLQGLEARYPGHQEVQSRRMRLDGSRSGSEESRPALKEILPDDFESVLDVELGRALTAEMAKEAGAPASPGASASAGVPVDESGLFSDEQEFFNFADELQSEMKQDAAVEAGAGGPGAEVSLEEIFREFKKGVEQQLSPEDFETHYNLGIAYKEMGLTDEAIGEFQIAAKDPLHAVDACSMLGLCFLEKGLPQLAIKWYRKGLETIGIRDEEKLGLQYDLASVFADVGDRENAYRTFLDIYGTSASYRDVGEKLKHYAPDA